MDTLRASSALSAVPPPQTNEEGVRLPAEAAAFDLGTDVEPIQESDAAMSSRISALLARLQGSQLVQPRPVKRAGTPPLFEPVSEDIQVEDDDPPAPSAPAISTQSHAKEPRHVDYRSMPYVQSLSRIENLLKDPHASEVIMKVRG